MQTTSQPSSKRGKEERERPTLLIRRALHELKELGQGRDLGLGRGELERKVDKALGAAIQRLDLGQRQVRDVLADVGEHGCIEKVVLA